MLIEVVGVSASRVIAESGKERLACIR